METQSSSSQKPLVILLHGITQGRRHMQPMARMFMQAGYPVAIIQYPWRNIRFESAVLSAPKDIQKTIGDLGHSIEPTATGKQYYPYVIFAHSMGGLVTRAMLAQKAIPMPQSIVFCGTPHHGSESADVLRKYFPPFRWLYGTLGEQLGTQGDAICQTLPQHTPEGVPSGAIAGNRSHWPLIKYLLPRPNDGKVAIASTHLEGELDHIILPVSHDNMYKHPTVAEAALNFFQYQRFEKPKINA